MAATKVQLIGGAFQDSEGNVLANGYLMMKLNQDELVAGVGQICSGIEIRINLTALGSVSTSPAQLVWGNDQMSPVNAYYRVSGFDSRGQLAWGPNNQQVIGSGGTFDVGTWVPNQVISWVPPLQPLLLETDGVQNGDQSLLNLVSGTGITLTDDGLGSVTIDSNGAGVTFQTNGTPNGDQTLLNLKNGSNVTITDDGLGGVTIATTPFTAFQNVFGSQHGWIANYAGGIGTDDVFSTVLHLSGTATNSLAPTATAGARYEVTLGASHNQSYFYNNSTRLDITRGSLQWFKSRAAISTTSTISNWVCVTDQNPASVFFPDNPSSANLIGFRYSTNAGDTQYQCVCSNGAASTIVSSGVNADTSEHIFQFLVSGSTVTFYIDGTLVATISTNVPAAATQMTYALTIDNLTTSNPLSMTAGYVWYSLV